jgi:hypothetical protein
MNGLSIEWIYICRDWTENVVVVDVVIVLNDDLRMTHIQIRFSFYQR